MKTIDERAKLRSEYYDEDDGYSAGVCVGYIDGATEQKDIDIEKAKTAFNNACGWLSTYPWYSEVVNEFIKNMEE